MKSFLSKYNFKLVGSIQRASDRLVFKSECEHTAEPTIYCWVLSEKRGHQFSPVAVLYAGKAGFGLKKRMSQHLGGFTHSTSGKKNSDHLENWIRKKYAIHVYKRIPENYMVFEKAMNGISIEEEFFIQAIKSNQCHKENGVLNRERYHEK